MNRKPTRALFFVPLLYVACLVLVPWEATSAQVVCGDESPAYPVTEEREGLRLWPDGFEPARPNQALPPDRDSTQFVGYPYPSAATGLELFQALDIVGDRLIVLYNTGIQVWDIGGVYAADPRRLAFRDGVLGQWLAHPGEGHEDGSLVDMAAIADPADPNRILIVTSGEAGSVGMAVFRYDRAQNRLSPIYQDLTRDGADVELVVYGGRVYALVSSATGAFVFDVSATNEIDTPCLDDEFATNCPAGIQLGKIGSGLVSRYIGAIVKDGALFVALSAGSISPSQPPPQIWQLDATQPGTAARRFLGSVRDSHSPLLIRRGSRYFLAVVEAKRLRIYEVGDCLDASGCTSLPAPSYDAALRSNTWSRNHLSYSESDGKPFLYYGVSTGNLSGSAVERLLDLSNLGGSNLLPEITASGQTYVDPCNGSSPIGFWAAHYSQNHLGLRNFVPTMGRFRGRYFYRTATAVLDVHVRTEVFSDGFESGDLSAWN